MMDVYYQGAGLREIGNNMLFLGVPGRHTFHNLFYKNMDSFAKKMNRELQVVIDEGFESKMQSTTNHKLQGEYIDVDISEYVRHFQHGSGFILNKIKKITIVASYDMDWNKCSIRRVYDSLPGHAFLIGFRSGNLLCLMYVQRNVQNAAEKSGQVLALLLMFAR